MSAINLALFVLFVAVVLWTILRRGKRLAALAARGLAFQCGGAYRPGGLFGPSSARLHHQGQAIQVTITSRSWSGTEFVATFQAPWSGGRPQLQHTSPSNLSGTDQQQLASRLQSSSIIRDPHIWTKGNTFFSQATLTSSSVPQVVHWFELVNRLYSLLHAETEAGIQFAETSPIASIATQTGIATCQVCGLPPSPHEVVLCNTCGAPHHQDCWDYNRGCAIYGCREKQPQ